MEGFGNHKDEQAMKISYGVDEENVLNILTDVNTKEEDSLTVRIMVRYIMMYQFLDTNNLDKCTVGIIMGEMIRDIKSQKYREEFGELEKAINKAMKNV